MRRHRDGGSVILQRGLPGAFVGEASLFAGSYHCDAAVVMRATVRLLSRHDIQKLFQSDGDFSVAWTRHLANEIRNARLRVGILWFETVSERLDTWLADKGNLPARGNRKSIALDLGTNAETLYREIALRRKHSK